MKDNNIKTILVLFFVIIILGCILGFKVLNRNSSGNEKKNTVKSNYSKNEKIDLIKTENNKSNFEVEYTLNKTKYKIKYLN